MLKVSDISVMYGAHRALEDAGVRVDSGEIVVILGANGAGKSSLLNAIAGTCEGKVRGKVELDGTSISHLPAEQIVGRGIAFVPEGRGIFGDMTVGENLLLGAHTKEARTHQDRNLARVYELFPKLREREKQVARTMSGGEQQMVAIGRAMMANPKILMLDEPSLGLSPLLCKELFQNLSHIRDAGIGVLMVEQNAKQSLAISDRAYLLENGTITGEDTAQSMMNDPAVQRAYLGGAASASAPHITHVAVGSGEEGARIGTNVVAAVAADSSPQKFIQPSGKNHAAGSSDQIAGVDIGSIVARASDVAAPRPENSVQPQTANRSAVSRSVRPIGGGIIGGALSSLPTNDPDIKNLLADFESAALRARSPATLSSNGKDTTTSSQNDPIEKYEDLPEIPVFRKSKLEVYRRTPAGDLMKVKER